MSSFENIRAIKRKIEGSNDQEFLYARKNGTTNSDGIYWRRDRIVRVEGDDSSIYTNTTFAGEIQNSVHTDNTKYNNPYPNDDLKDSELISNFDQGWAKACFYKRDYNGVEFTSTIPDSVYKYFDTDWPITNHYNDIFDITYENPVILKNGLTTTKTVYKTVKFKMKSSVQLTNDLDIYLMETPYYSFNMSNTVNEALLSRDDTNILLNGTLSLKGSPNDTIIYSFVNDNTFSSLEFLYEGKLKINIDVSSVFSGISSNVQNFVQEVSNEGYTSYNSFILNNIVNNNTGVIVNSKSLEPKYTYDGRNYYLMLRKPAIESANISSGDGVSSNISITLICTGLYTSWIANWLGFFESFYAPIELTMYQSGSMIGNVLTIGDETNYSREDFMLLTDIEYDGFSETSTENALIISYKDFEPNWAQSSYIDYVKITTDYYDISNIALYGSYRINLGGITHTDHTYSFYLRNCYHQILFGNNYYNARITLLSPRKTRNVPLGRQDNGCDFGNYSDYYKWFNSSGSSISTIELALDDRIIYTSDSRNNDGQLTKEIYTPIAFDQSGTIIDDTQYDANYNFKAYKWYYKSSVISNDSLRAEFNFKVSSYESTTRLAKFEFLQYSDGDIIVVDSSTSLTFKAITFIEAYKWNIPVSHYGITEVRIGEANTSSLPSTQQITFGSRTFNNYISSGSSTSGINNKNLLFYGSERSSIWFRTKRITYTYNNITSYYYYYPPNQFFKELVGFYSYNDLYIINNELWMQLTNYAKNTDYGPNGKQIKSCVLTIDIPSTTEHYTLNEPITLYVEKQGLYASTDSEDETGAAISSSAHLEALISCENYLRYTGSSSSQYYAYNIPNWRFYYRTNFDDGSFTQMNGKYYEAYKWFFSDEGYHVFSRQDNPELYFRSTSSIQNYISRNNDLYHLPIDARELRGQYGGDLAYQQVEVAGLDMSFAFAIGANSINSGAWTTDIALHDGSTTSTHIDYITAGASIGMRQTGSLESGSAFFGYISDRTRSEPGTLYDRYLYQGLEGKHYYRKNSEVEFLHFRFKKFRT